MSARVSVRFTRDLDSLPVSPAVRSLNPELFPSPDAKAVITPPATQSAPPVPAPPLARRSRVTRVSNPVAQPDARGALEPRRRREAKGVLRPASRPRLSVVFRLYRVRLLDFDNAGGSVKFLCDALRAEGVIPDDDPGSIIGTVEQVRVAGKSEERTEVEVRELPPEGHPSASP